MTWLVPPHAQQKIDKLPMQMQTLTRYLHGLASDGRHQRPLPLEHRSHTLVSNRIWAPAWCTCSKGKRQSTWPPSQNGKASACMIFWRCRSSMGNYSTLPWSYLQGMLTSPCSAPSTVVLSSHTPHLVILSRTWPGGGTSSATQMFPGPYPNPSPLSTTMHIQMPAPALAYSHCRHRWQAWKLAPGWNI